MENLFFKTEDDYYHKIESDYDKYAENPRKLYENLGKMFFKEQNRNRLGDEQVSDFSDFFIGQLSSGQGDERKIKGKIVVDIPTLSEALNHRVLNKLYVAGTQESGFHFDIDKFYQDFEAQLSSICDTYRKLGFVDDIVCNIPFDENHKLTNNLEIEFESPYFSDYESDSNFNQVIDAIKATIDSFDVKYSDEENLTSYKYKDLTEKELFDLWAKNQFYVLPINIFEHSDIVLHPGTLQTRTEKWLDGSSIEEITNSGFIYVSKDNEEVQKYLKEHSEEETKEWIENVFKGEIETYSNYVRGEVYIITDKIFNKNTLEWSAYNEISNVYGNPEDFIKYTYGKVEYISQKDIQELENTITAEYTKTIGSLFFDEIKECLSDFDGNLLYAQRSVFNSWNKNPTNELFPNKIKMEALKRFLVNNGCDSPENTIKFLKENIQPMQKREFDPFSFEAKENGYETWLNPNSNKNASNYNSRISPKHALIIDTQSKRFGILSGADYFTGSALPNYDKNPLLSDKKFKEKIEELQALGFSFEKFTGKNAEYAQGNLENFLPKKENKRTKSDDFGR